MIMGSLRKALMVTTTLANNAASFVNETNEDLHIRKIEGNIWFSGTSVVGDISQSSLDESPVAQNSIDDSRSHIAQVTAVVNGGTGAINGVPGQKVLSFNRGDLVLEPDEALFVNTVDVAGAAPTGSNWNIFYQE